MNSFDKVEFSRCEDYDVDKISDIIRRHFTKIGVTKDTFYGKKVALKPNLVSAKDPSAAATTHPAVVEAVYRVIRELGGTDVILAESPGGPYTVMALNRIYKATGMTEMAHRASLPLNTDVTYGKMSFSEGKKLKSFDVITPIMEADVIVNICKLKTHSLTGMSCAVKNLFGVVPGTLKVELHAAYPLLRDFSEMLVDLNLSLMRDKHIISICDGIVSMEGNGPTHGIPVRTGIILTSNSTFALDIAAEKYIGAEGETIYLDIGAERLGIPRSCDDKELTETLGEKSLARPDSKAGSLLRNLPNYFGGSLARALEPKPRVNPDKCVGCGKCTGFCPQKTIEIKKKKGKKVAHIKEKNCIRCYCCQELCPSAAVDTVKNLLLRLVH